MIQYWQLILFSFGTIGILWISRASLRDNQSRGYYRFSAWKALLIMFVMNGRFWFADPFSLRQIIAWFFLILSLILIIQGVRLFQQKGDIDPKGKMAILWASRRHKIIRKPPECLFHSSGIRGWIPETRMRHWQHE